MNKQELDELSEEQKCMLVVLDKLKLDALSLERLNSSLTIKPLDHINNCDKPLLNALYSVHRKELIDVLIKLIVTINTVTIKDFQTN